MASTTVSLKLLIDSKANRVLFAEASKEFVDFLFNILSLLVGTVIRLLTNEGMVGCLGNLYASIENLSDTYILPNQSKNSILNPKVPPSASNVPLLLPKLKSPATSTVFYRCAANSGNNNCLSHVTTNPNVNCPQCNRVMQKELMFVEAPEDQGPASDEGGYVKGVVTYMIMDDLVVRPMSTISSITMLNKFNVKEVGALEEKIIELSMHEGVKLLKAALESKNALTDVFLGKKGGKEIYLSNKV